MSESHCWIINEQTDRLYFIIRSFHAKHFTGRNVLGFQWFKKNRHTVQNEVNKNLVISIYWNTLLFKSLGSVVSSAHQGCIYFRTNIVKYYFNLKRVISIWIYFKIYFIPVMQTQIFSIITPVFSVTWSFRKRSNMLPKKHLSTFYFV